MSQTTYSVTPAAAYAGQLAGIEPKRIGSYFNEVASALQFGIMVAQGTAKNQVLNVSGTGDDIVGVTVRAHQDDTSLAGATGIPASGGKADIIREGRVWVAVEEAVVAGDPVFFRHTSGGGGTVIGKFRNDADTASCDALPNARFLDYDATNSVALLELNMP